MTVPRPLRSPLLLALFAGCVLLPAAALAVLAWRGAEGERRALRAERAEAIARAGRLIRREVAAVLEDLRREEEARPYYQYNLLFVDPQAVGQGTNWLPSPIAAVPENPLVEAYFRIDPQGAVDSPNEAQVLVTDKAIAEVAPEQKERTRRAVRGALDNLVPEIRRDREAQGEPQKGEFPGVTGDGRKDAVPRRALAANAQTRQQTAELLEGRAAQQDFGGLPGAEERLEVLASPMAFRAEPGGGVLAFRYVDVPDPEGSGFSRFVNGFRLDTGHLRDVLFPDIARRCLIVEGAEAALTADPGGGEGAEFADEVPGLPGWRVLVFDRDPAWADRRAGRLRDTLLLTAGGLFLVIAGGLFFAVRTVRAELAFARRKSEFVSAVSHELRTPLTGIRMYADLLHAGWVKDEGKRAEYVRFLAEETDRLTRLVNRVLDFSRADRGRLSVRAVELAGPVREVAESFGPSLKERGLSLSLDLASPPPVLADPDAVRQILLNLLENAARHGRPADPPAVTVRVAREGARVVLSVADHGPGIPPAERAGLFSELFRRGGETARESAGTGIGLALVRRLAEAMGGTAEFAGTPGGGATFRVSFRPAE